MECEDYSQTGRAQVSSNDKGLMDEKKLEIITTSRPEEMRRGCGFLEHEEKV